MTVKEVLVKSPWNVSYSGNENWEKFINKVGKWNCSLPAVIRKDLNYYELWQKKQGVIRVFQDGNCCDFYEMDPCKAALCVHFSGLPLALAEIYEYRQKPFEEVYLHALDQNVIAISKKALNFEGPFQDGSENRDIHVIMRYISPKSACAIQEKE